MEYLKRQPKTPKELAIKGLAFFALGLIVMPLVITLLPGAIFAIFGFFMMISGIVLGFAGGWNTPIKDINLAVNKKRLAK